MKSFFIAALALVSGASAQAQEAKPDARFLQRALAYKMKGSDTIRNFSPRIEIVSKKRVQTLPQDNMPCIVPDTKDMAVMPNALLKEKPMPPVAGQIPNAWKKREGEKSVIVK